MSRIYFDCFSGASGDMIVGSLLDLGVSLDQLTSELQKLKLRNYTLSADRVVKSGITATKFTVHAGHEHVHRNFQTIATMIRESVLSDPIKESATRIFLRLAEAEARVHGSTVDQVHFHEVGAIDSIVDIVGACIGFELLDVQEILASPLNVGNGTVKAAHGILPVPAPATVELLKGIPVYANQIEGELVTPTGAAILSTLAKGFGSLPPFEIEGVGYGAGTRDTRGSANVLRALQGPLSSPPISDQEGNQRVMVIEANIDDMNPQLYGVLQERLLKMGVLDTFVQPVQMKKNRPGILLTVVASPEQLMPVTDEIFQETTTIGIRYYEASRSVLEREMVPLDLEGGSVRVKVSRRGGRIVNFTPEFEDCRALAEQREIPVKVIQARVTQEFMSRFGRELLSHGKEPRKKDK
ncbi:MAG: nickel pincer cofactor biosynthesis protein LarC [Terriglobia bacterium]